MKVAVTGANGFVGMAACRALLHAGCTVRGLTRACTELVPGVDPLVGDLHDPPALDRLFAGVDVVVHTAGLVRSVDPAALAWANVEGTRAVLERATDVRTLVHISTAGVHGRPGGIVHENSPITPPDPYEASKASAEEVLRSSRSSGLVILRPTNILGVAHPADPLVRFLRAVRAGRLVTTATAWSNYVSVHVVADTIAALAASGDAPEVLLVNEGMSVADLGALAAGLLGVPDRARVLAPWASRLVTGPIGALGGAVRSLDRARALVDTTRIVSTEEAWLASRVPPALSITLGEMVQDYRARALL